MFNHNQIKSTANPKKGQVYFFKGMSADISIGPNGKKIIKASDSTEVSYYNGSYDAGKKSGFVMYNGAQWILFDCG